MKKFFSIVMACVMALGIVSAAAACGEGGGHAEQGKLTTPQGLTMAADGSLHWTAVEHATGYLVTIGSASASVKETSYTVEAEALKEDFTYSVQATAEGYETSDAAVGNYLAPDVQVAISAGSTQIRSGMSLNLKATVAGASDTSVVWSVVEGGEYVSVDEKGKVTAKAVTDDHAVVIRATSVARPSRYAEKNFTVVARTALTQSMLDALNKPTAEFSGSLSIDAYTIGTFSDLETSTTRTVLTKMDGTHWYGEYEDANGITQYLYYKNDENIAKQVGLSLLNGEDLYPMYDEAGSPVSWRDAGLYNTFAAPLKMEDFAFDEETWLWKYVGDDETFAQRAVAAANPYDFTPKNLFLDIHGGEVIGFISESESDYKVAAGYRCEMSLSVIVNFENVEVPTISVFPTDPTYHPALQEAIDNMRSLKSFKTEVRHYQYAFTSASENFFGYEETVTPDLCYFKEFNYTYASQDGSRINKTYTGAEYGFKKISDTLYNSFSIDADETYYAMRAVEGSIDEVKPQFEFAAEIFRGSVTVDPTTGYQTFYADPVMTSVATQLYCGLTNDDALYGIFAARGSTTGEYLPRITVDPVNKLIVSSSFFYDLGMLYGAMEIKYSDFDAVESTETVEFEERNVPVSWAELLATDDKGTDSEADDTEIGCDEYIQKELGDVEVPFFGEILGDRYGFAMSSFTFYHPRRGGRGAKTVVFYYDVPLDRNYSLEEPISEVEAWLIREKGFTRNEYGELVDGKIGILLVDNALDLLIYVWDDTPFQTPQNEAD